MSDENPLPTDPSEYGGTVSPHKRRFTRGTEYSDEFTYSQVHIERGATDALSDKANITRDGDTIFYRYERKPPVMVTGGGVHAHEDYSVKATQEQAFFILSMLASEGYVSNWSKK